MSPAVRLVGLTGKPEPCSHCRVEISDEEIESGKAIRKRDGYGKVYRFHPECFDRYVEDRKERAALERERAVRYAVERIEAMFSSEENTPRWPWARFGNEAFRKRVKQAGGGQILTAVERWSPSAGSLLISAPTGRGKTASMVAWLWRWRARSIAAAEEAGGAIETVARHCWATGHEAIKARKQHGLGDGEAPLIKRAFESDILVLDEIGYESAAPDPIVFEIIDLRYRRELPTVVTTGLALAEFGKRYGEAMVRRLLEPGTIVEAK